MFGKGGKMKRIKLRKYYWVIIDADGAVAEHAGLYATRKEAELWLLSSAPENVLKVQLIPVKEAK